MGDRASRLEVWTVATFDLAALSVLFLLAGHLSGALSGALAGLGTIPGLLLFGYLWGLVVVAVRWVLADGGLVRRTEIQSLLIRGGVGGAAVGIGLVAGVVPVAGAIAAIENPAFVTSLALVASIGTVVGAVVGAAVGLLFAAVNVLVVRASEWTVPTTDRGQ
jgi:hypothetical protein